MPDIKLSIALITRNRPDSLSKTLESLRKQSVQPFEVIISDNSDSEVMVTRNKALADKYGSKYITGQKRGLYANRNFVAKHCTGTHIRTMDDDHTFPDDHLNICFHKIKEDPSSIWIIGEWYPNETPDSLTPHCPGEIHPRGFSIKPKDEQNCKAISCGASIYPRIVVDKNILNVEYFEFGYSYLEYGCRLNHLGFRIRHIEETYIFHEYYSNPPSFNNEIAMMDSRIFAMMALSFLYEPTIKNKFYTITQLGIWLLKNKKQLKQSVVANITRIRELRKNLQSLLTFEVQSGILK